MDIGQLNYRKDRISVDPKLSLVVRDLAKRVLRDRPPESHLYRYCANVFAEEVGRALPFDSIPGLENGMAPTPRQLALDGGMQERTLAALESQKGSGTVESQTSDLWQRKLEKKAMRMKRREEQMMKDRLEEMKIETERLERARQNAHAVEERRKQVLAEIKAIDAEYAASNV